MIQNLVLSRKGDENEILLWMADNVNDNVCDISIYLCIICSWIFNISYWKKGIFKMEKPKVRYFKDKDAYFRFVNKNRNKIIKKFICSFNKNKIKVIYQFL